MILKNTYFGFTDNKKPMQGAKIEKSLDMLIRYNDKVMTEKEFIYAKLQEGSKPDYEENYSYYSVRKDDYTKPKTLYKLNNNDNTYNEINKTLYNYALHLINNNYLNKEVASQFIQQEKEEKEQQEKLEQERIQKEREDAERKQQEQQKKDNGERQRKIEAWSANGKELLSNIDTKSLITEVVKSHWKEIKEQYPATENYEQVTKLFMNEINQMIGNEAYSIYELQYLHDCALDFQSIKFIIKRDILMKVYDVQENDPKQTITAKVKAFHNNKQYKGSNSTNVNKEECFYIMNKDKEREQVIGKRINVNGIKCFIYKNKDEQWVLSELSSGARLTSGETQKVAKDKLKEFIERNGKDRINQQIEMFVNQYGYSNKETA